MMERITDKTLGDGYPSLINARLACDEPERYTVLNRGISGHRISDIYARIKKDCINLAPDVLSLMIGINDVWHECSFRNGVDNGRFARIYDMMLEEILEALPNIRIILLQPYVFEGMATKEHWDFFRDETALRAQVVEQMAEKYNAYLIRTQKLLDDACAKTGTASALWAYDGVHPTPAGHQLIADEWLRVFRGLSL
jgi:lysophospholipase L1-like esterase